MARMRPAVAAASEGSDEQAPGSRLRLGLLGGATMSVLLCLLVIANLLPLVWGVLTSFKSDTDLFRFPPTFFSFTPTLEHYARVTASGFFGSLRASLIYAFAAVFLTLLLALPAAYAFD